MAMARQKPEIIISFQRLLRPWLVEEANGDLNLHGYWWDKEAKLVSKRSA